MVITLQILLDGASNFSLKTQGLTDGWSMLLLELDPERALQVWMDLEDQLELEGLVWEDDSFDE